MASKQSCVRVLISNCLGSFHIRENFFFLRKGYFHQVELKTDRNHLYLGGNPRVFYKNKKKPVKPGVASGMVMYFGPAVIWCCHAKLYLRLRSVTKPQLVTHLRGSFWRRRKRELGKIE